MRRVALSLAAGIAVAGCTVASGPKPAATLSPITTVSASPQPTDILGLVPVSDPGHVTGKLTGPCHVVGTVPSQLPDPRCTPGSYDPRITAAMLCSGSYRTGTYRPPSSETTSFKYHEAYPAYGIPDGTTSELDHLVSLELGGTNDATNLWPEQPGVPNPKDSVENQLHTWVCAVTGANSESRLQDARVAIARNWTTAEKVLGINA